MPAVGKPASGVGRPHCGRRQPEISRAVLQSETVRPELARSLTTPQCPAMARRENGFDNGNETYE
jgi:hypothetical protein